MAGRFMLPKLQTAAERIVDRLCFPRPSCVLGVCHSGYLTAIPLSSCGEEGWRIDNVNCMAKALPQSDSINLRWSERH